jgi:hypothetical protein
MILANFEDQVKVQQKQLNKNSKLTLNQLSSVTLVQVNEEDLSKIINTFESFPFHLTEDPQIWTGDMAKYIIANSIDFTEGVGEVDRLLAFSSCGELLLSWKQGELLEVTDLELVENTCYVFSTFAEMPWILSRMRNIPYVRDAVIQIWTGDIARFIVGQLPSKDGQQY